jgi:hypothetical protein
VEALEHQLRAIEILYKSGASCDTTDAKTGLTMPPQCIRQLCREPATEKIKSVALDILLDGRAYASQDRTRDSSHRSCCPHHHRQQIEVKDTTVERIGGSSVRLKGKSSLSQATR